jgi:putative DNA methylase
MTQPYKKKLIEVAIPLEAINKASVREKGIRHGHPSSLHLWWARRPLAACRAVLFAQLVDDPSSNPDKFPTQEAQEVERKRLFEIIEELVVWENSTNEEILNRARNEILKSCDGDVPPVYDPFSGGGSIPLEAQRLGLPAYGSDLNPVAVMIGKAMIEVPPRFKDNPPVHPGSKDRQFYRNSEGLSEDVKYYGDILQEKAKKAVGHLYPQVDLPAAYGGGKGTPIAWIWARTVPSPDPAFAHIEVPLVSSFILSTKTGGSAWIEPVVDKILGKIHFVVHKGGTAKDFDKARTGTKAGTRAHFHCLMSDSAITPEYIRAQATAGNMGQMLIGIIAEGPKGRAYVSPTDEQSQAAFANEATETAKAARETFLSGGTPPRLTGGTCHAYGLNEWGKLFSDRQLAGLMALVDALPEVRAQIERDAAAAGLGDDGQHLVDRGSAALAYGEAIIVYLSFLISQVANHSSTLCGWNSANSQMRATFARQALPMNWDFAECNIFSNSSGSYANLFDRTIKGFSTLGASTADSSIVQLDAQSVNYQNNYVVSTDPPYYDNIAYADLSDFFYVWLKKNLGEIFGKLTSTIVVPKSEELVATAYRHGGRENAEAFFLQGMTRAIGRIAEGSSSYLPVTIYYAFKQSEIEAEGLASTGWATFIEAVIKAGFSVVATWPVRTEKPGRMVAIGTNALANSVVLVCRRRAYDAGVVSRAEFTRSLRRELPPAIAELQAANIAPADMPQSAIGPGMGVFSRYDAVLESDDSPMSVKAALQLINRELDEYLGGIQGEFDADTRFAITWFEQNGLKAGDYGTANNIATARGISVESVKHAGIVESQAGKVRVLRRDELDDQWEPGNDQHLTIWECLQHLVRLHEKDGISNAAAVLLKKIGDKAEAVKDLAYILYDISANKRQDAKEATTYNALIADWTELSRQAAAIYDTRGDLQQRLDL